MSRSFPGIVRPKWDAEIGVKPVSGQPLVVTPDGGSMPVVLPHRQKKTGQIFDFDVNINSLSHSADINAPDVGWHLHSLYLSGLTVASVSGGTSSDKMWVNVYVHTRGASCTSQGIDRNSPLIAGAAAKAVLLDDMRLDLYDDDSGAAYFAMQVTGSVNPVVTTIGLVCNGWVIWEQD
jgi:hypothetical protein